MIDINKVTHLLSVFTWAGAIQVLGESPLLSSPEWTDEPNGTADHQVLMFSWHESNKEAFLIFTEQGISDARVVGQTVRMKDVNDEDREIAVWQLTPVSIDKVYHTV
jgi:hypothetical protein